MFNFLLFIFFYCLKEAIELDTCGIEEYVTHNSTGPFVLPCTVSTRPLGQNT